jgi:hypothetical protein
MGEQLICDKQTLEKKQRELLTIIPKGSTHHHTQRLIIFFLVLIDELTHVVVDGLVGLNMACMNWS